MKITDNPQEECGVIGVYARGNTAARLAFFGLFALQHRGQESAGIATSDQTSIYLYTDLGLVSQVFREDDLASLPGDLSIGHTRYSTTGANKIGNAQPFHVKGIHGSLALAHNGNVINSVELRNELQEKWNCQFNSSTDSEVMAQLLVNAPGESWKERCFYGMRRLKGAFSATILTPTSLIGMRDPLGVRPLCIGSLNGGWIITSESCALDHLGADLIRELEPGEVVIIDSNGPRYHVWPGNDGRRAMCVFEMIYFARPDSRLNTKPVYSMRVKMGAQLAQEHPADADLVIGVPDSATAAAVGYSRESGIPFSEGLVKNRYVGRTFIEPDQRLRDIGVRLKFNPLTDVIKDKRLVVVDDSIVRGTTTPHVVNILRKAGAKEVHMRVCAPPIRWPCHFGVDMATRRELIAANKSIDEIRQYIGADSLGYLSVENLMKAVDGTDGGFCHACFSGDYPIPVQLEMDKLILEKS